MSLPFEGAISAFYKDSAQADLRALIDEADKDDIANPRFPYPEKWDKGDYEDTLESMQIELVKLQAWAKETGARIAVVFEGRDAAGKGGTIKRLRENLNPRSTHIVALSKPTETESSQWYFQRYITHLPAAGQMVVFDRSWYNRGVVEHVFGFCTPKERGKWFDQVNPFEQMLADEGITLIKFWINVGQATQLERFLKREKDPLKQWKLSWIDVEGLKKWDAYSEAIAETLSRTHTETAPWRVIKGDDKRRARVAAIREILSHHTYAAKNDKAVGKADPKIISDPVTWANLWAAG